MITFHNTNFSPSSVDSFFFYPRAIDYQLLSTTRDCFSLIKRQNDYCVYVENFETEALGDILDNCTGFFKQIFSPPFHASKSSIYFFEHMAQGTFRFFKRCMYERAKISKSGGDRSFSFEWNWCDKNSWIELGINLKSAPAVVVQLSRGLDGRGRF